MFLTDLPFAELEANGLDYESLCALKPDIVLTRGSGFGPEGPDRDLPALDELAAARTGVMPTLVQPGSRRSTPASARCRRPPCSRSAP